MHQRPPRLITGKRHLFGMLDVLTGTLLLDWFDVNTEIALGVVQHVSGCLCFFIRSTDTSDDKVIEETTNDTQQEMKLTGRLPPCELAKPSWRAVLVCRSTDARLCLFCNGALASGVRFFTITKTKPAF